MTSDISVVIPAYNAEKFLRYAVQSVLDQTIAISEIIVVDDGSAIPQSTCIRGLRNPRKTNIHVVPIRHSGLSAARNKGIQQSQAGFIAFLDADDLWKKEKLEKQVSVYANTNMKNLGLVYCDYEFISGTGVRIHDKREIGNNDFRYKLDPLIRGDIMRKQLMFNQVAGSASAVLIKRECFDHVGLFDERLGAYEDMDMWIRISEHYQIDFVSEPLVYLRRHRHNMTGGNTYKTIHEKLKLYQKWKRHPYVTKEICAYWYTLIIQEWLDGLCHKTFRKHISVVDIWRSIMLFIKYPGQATSLFLSFILPIIKRKLLSYVSAY